jgi:hypothetical protein
MVSRPRHSSGSSKEVVRLREPSAARDKRKAEKENPKEERHRQGRANFAEITQQRLRNENSGAASVSDANQ